MSQSKFEANACIGRLAWKSALANQIRINHETNRPLLSSNNPHFQNEARCKIFLVKMSFICMRKKNDFHINGWAPILVLKQRPTGTRKWPILNLLNQSKLEAGACRRSKGREKVLADQWNAKLLSDPINQSKLKAGACSWRYARENVCKQVTIELLLPLIGWKSGAKCFSQSHYVAIQKQSNSELVSILSYPVVTNNEGLQNLWYYRNWIWRKKLPELVLYDVGGAVEPCTADWF